MTPSAFKEALLRHEIAFVPHRELYLPDREPDIRLPHTAYWRRD
jgi:hypothetical protein